MELKKVTISGFRSIQGPIELNLGSVNAIIGPNNSGKSNILQAIYRVLGKDWVTKNSFDESDVYLEDYDTDITIDIEFKEPFKHQVFVGFEVPIPKVRFFYTRYKVGEYAGQRRLEKQCLTLQDKPVFTFKKKPKAGERPEMAPLTTIPQELQESIPVIYIGVDRELKYQLPKSRNSLLGTLMNDINRDFESETNKIKVRTSKGELDVPRKWQFDRCIKAAIEALRTDAFEKLEKSIQTNALIQLGFDPIKDADKIDVFFNPLTSTEFYKSLEIYVKEHDYQINATELGSGFQNALVISIMKAFEERKKQGAIFLIEEPEMYLHPQMQRSLYKTLRKIGETNQVIYVTHSPHFVTIPEFEEIIITSKDSNGTDVKTSSIIATPELKDKFRKELDPERNELFFARRILIVEGDTEKLAFPEYAKRMDLDFDQVGSSIIEAGGKRDLKTYVDLALSFNIPVGFAYDTDSSDFNGKREEEKAFNEILEFYKKSGVEVFSFSSNFEAECKKFFGENQYQKYCEQYGKNKTQRARFIAQDEEIPIPEFVKPIINWLGKKQ